MKCFIPFTLGDKKDEPTKSSISTFTEEMKRQGSSELDSRNASSGGSSGESARRASFPSLAQRPSGLRVFSVAELKLATKNFSRSAMVGEGGFGCVYKGLIKDAKEPSKRTEVAVKQLSKSGLQGHKEWVTEVNVLGVVEHPNLVELVGYCAEDDERGIQRLLVYEFMPNGSVEQHLSPRSDMPLPWPMRLRIAVDAARGLAHLHEQMDFQIIFRDFKSSNILLDEQWKAKLSDFGMARLGPPEGSTHVSTAVVGTMGYAAPEYIQTGRLTSKNDVWSYGVFLYELITGRKPIDKNRPKGEQKLLEWVRSHLADTKKFRLIVDPRLQGKYSLKSVQKLSLIANRCLTRLPKNRPKMSEVLDMVAKLAEASPTGLGPETPPVPLRDVSASAETSRGVEKKNKRRIVEIKTGDNCWSFRIWPPKIIRTF